MRLVCCDPMPSRGVTFRLSKDHLALLHRMQTIRTTIRLETDDGVVTRRIDLHSPASGR